MFIAGIWQLRGLKVCFYFFIELFTLSAAFLEHDVVQDALTDANEHNVHLTTRTVFKGTLHFNYLVCKI